MKGERTFKGSQDQEGTRAPDRQPGSVEITGVGVRAPPGDPAPGSVTFLQHWSP